MAEEYSEDGDIKVVKRKRDEKEEEKTLNNHKNLKFLVFLNFLSKEDALLLCNFFSKHREAYLLGQAFSLKTKGFAYGRLADLIRLLRDHTMLELLDSRSYLLSEHLDDLRHFFLRSTLLDSIERRLFPCFTSSSSYDVSHGSLKNLEDSEARLREDIETLRSKVDSLSCHITRCELSSRMFLRRSKQCWKAELL